MSSDTATKRPDLPDAEDTPNKCTEFTADVPDGEIEPDEFRFGFVCPRCGETNVLVGDPRGFKNKPFRCLNCNYVPLLPAEEVEQFAQEEYDDE